MEHQSKQSPLLSDNDTFAQALKRIEQQFSQFSTKKCNILSNTIRIQGNELFSKKHNDDTHMEVIILYSKSIALAPIDSEELALGYGNRSAILLHIQKYEECINDIDKALSISKSNTFQTKMTHRKNFCLKLICELSKLTVPEKFKIPKLSPSEMIPCVSEKLSLKYSEECGKHMIANEDIKPGEIIAIEEAYVTFPQIEKLHIVCSHCLSQTWNGVPCDYCALMIYCSDDCKNEAWKEYHDIECSIILSCPPPKPLAIRQQYAGLRLLIKIIKKYSLEQILRMIKFPESLDVEEDSKIKELKTLYHLESKSPDSSSSILEDFVSKSIEFLLEKESIFLNELKFDFLTKDEIIILLKEFLMKMTKIITFNSYKYESNNCCKNCCNCELNALITCGVNCKTRGIMFNLFCNRSFFHHSCSPNLGIIFAPNKQIILYATTPVKKGDQIFITYLPNALFMEKSKRHHILSNKYLHNCCCQACEENWPLLDTTSFAPSLFTEEISLINESLKHRHFNEKTLNETIQIIEVLYTKSTHLEAVKNAFVLHHYVHEMIAKLYGIDWKKFHECSTK